MAVLLPPRVTVKTALPVASFTVTSLMDSVDGMATVMPKVAVLPRAASPSVACSENTRADPMVGCAAVFSYLSASISSSAWACVNSAPDAPVNSIDTTPELFDTV